MAWKFLPDSPVYIQIADKIRCLIISGEYVPGQQLPTVRQFAVEAAVNPNTIQHAFTELEGQGIIVSKGTAGRFVTDNLNEIDMCRKVYVKKIVGDLLATAKRMAVSKEELIAMIKEGDV